jgi:hypothetical protein
LFIFKEFVREAEVPYGPNREIKKTEVVVPVVEVTTTASVKQMIGYGSVAAQVEGVVVQNGLTTLNHVIIGC